MMKTVKKRISSLEERAPHRMTNDRLFGRVAEMMRLAGMSFDEALRSVVTQVSTEDLRRILAELRSKRANWRRHATRGE
jgi:hypothetical protein